MLATVWDYIKRAFGRSRTIFVNVVGLGVVAFVENIDVFLAVDWDALFKHEVAVGIGLGLNVANIVLRVVTTGPVSFKRIEPDGPCSVVN